MKKIFIAVLLLFSLNVVAQKNVHHITPIVFLGDSIKTVTINNSLSLNDSTVYITVTFNTRQPQSRQLNYPISDFRPFANFVVLKQRVLAKISTDLGITILD